VSALFKTFKYERGKGVGLTWGKLVRTDTVNSRLLYPYRRDVNRKVPSANVLACEAGVSIKPGAQAPGSDHKNKPLARENGRQPLSPAIAG